MFCSGQCPGHLLGFHGRISGPPPAPPTVKAYGVVPNQKPSGAAFQVLVKENQLKIHCPMLTLFGKQSPIELHPSIFLNHDFKLLFIVGTLYFFK